MTPQSDRAALREAVRVVVKVGTAVVTRDDGGLALGRLGALVEQLRALQAQGREVILVSSGAVGLGAEMLGLERPTSVVDRQACAATGQSALVAFYDTLFSKVGGHCAQVLLTEDDFRVRRRHVNLAATLQRLLQLGVVPVINENDTVSTAELALTGPTVFGDNDRLSALVASGIAADALLLLSDVDGVYTAPPAEPGSTRVGVWQPDTEVRFGSASSRGRGGMQAKITAARMGTVAGVHVVIADGRDPSTVGRVLAGHDVGTLFPATPGLSSRKRWLAFATAPAGRLTINEGAAHAMRDRKASLLAVGMVGVEGRFDAGAIVSVVGPDGEEMARGRVDRSADDLRAAVGQPASGRDRPVVHRDHVVMFDKEE